MNKPLLAIACAFLLLASGCFFGDAVTGRTVSLDLEMAQQQTTTLSVRDAQVQEALKLIDSVVVANGYTRSPHEIDAESRTHGVIVSYGLCVVILRSNRLLVDIVEGNYSGQLSPRTRRVIEQLKSKLSNRYGAEHVKVDRRQSGVDPN